MRRVSFALLILALGFTLQSCAGIECHPVDDSAEGTKKFNMSKDEMWDEISRREAENEMLTKRIEALQEEKRERKGENKSDTAEVKNQDEMLNEEIREVREENIRVKAENSRLSEKIVKIEAELEKNVRELKIKVLSGDGDLNSAKQTAERLRNSGYTIKSIGRAPRSNFTTSTVYYATNTKNEAERLISSLDGNPVLKPLSWPSMFDIIVVTGASR